MDLKYRYVIPAPKEDGGFVSTDDLKDAHFLATQSGAKSFKRELFREDQPKKVLETLDIDTEETTQETPQHKAREQQAKDAAAALKEKDTKPKASAPPENIGRRMPSGVSFFPPEGVKNPKPGSPRAPEIERSEVVPPSQPVKAKRVRVKKEKPAASAV